MTTEKDRLIKLVEQQRKLMQGKLEKIDLKKMQRERLDTNARTPTTRKA